MWVFAWRLAHHSLPSGAVVHRQNMSNMPKCAIFHADDDSWRHSLIDCIMSCCILALVDAPLTEHMCMNRCPDAKEWLFHMMETILHEDFIKILLTLWAIKSGRRKAIHESIFRSPVTIYGFFIRIISDLEITSHKPQRSRAPVLAAALKWILPPEVWAKLNVDAGIGKTRPKGAAVIVCWDDAGKYLGWSTRVLDNCIDLATLKCIVCFEALVLA